MATGAGWKPVEHFQNSLRVRLPLLPLNWNQQHGKSRGESKVLHMLRKQPFIVVDQSRIRDVSTIAAALDRCCRENLQLLLPDGAGFEMSDGSQRLKTWKQSLHVVKDYSEFVSVSRKLSAMLSEELNAGRPCERIVDSHATEETRSILRSLAGDDDSPLRSLIDGPVAEMMPASLDEWSNHEQHKNLILTMVRLLKSEMTDEEVRQLRGDPVNKLGEWLSTINGIRFVFQWLKSCKVNDESALLLCTKPSVSASFATGLAAIAIYWLAFGGIEGKDASDITNDLHDMECSVLGSLSVGLVAEDKRLNRIAEAVSAAVQQQQNEIATILNSSS